ncbi:MAG: prepilin-type N-terminal cleavage/methylation domain-containing protein [Enterobacterales bacterium]|nr:prepilin-type N-terminal cleavage/methylation domain-containing protein [Enterobacterales bacterium]
MKLQKISFCSMKNTGFSLLEIIIAMAIMAILTAVLFPKLGADSDKLAKKKFSVWSQLLN